MEGGGIEEEREKKGEGRIRKTSNLMSYLVPIKHHSPSVMDSLLRALQ